MTGGHQGNDRRDLASPRPAQQGQLAMVEQALDGIVEAGALLVAVQHHRMRLQLDQADGFEGR
ncbi:hypothetical protein D3C76_1608150 [compost metagenome]